LPCIQLRLSGGDTVTLALHGAQVLSWVAGGRERLYLSDRAVFDGQAAIRGGVPVCFPQFNQRGAMPKHGFARNLPWSVRPSDAAVNGFAAGAGSGMPAEMAQVSLSLRDGEPTRRLWPQAFEATLTAALSPGSLQITLTVRNTDEKPLQFTGALHTYLAVDDITAVRLDGLRDQPCWDALTDQTGPGSDGLRFDGEFDRVYAAAPTPLTLRDGNQRLQISQSASLSDTVVWNPGAALCGRLGDMPADGFKRMLCVEAARVIAPVDVAAGAEWQGWQRLAVL